MVQKVAQWIKHWTVNHGVWSLIPDSICTSMVLLLLAFAQHGANSLPLLPLFSLAHQSIKKNKNKNKLSKTTNTTAKPQTLSY